MDRDVDKPVSIRDRAIFPVARVYAAVKKARDGIVLVEIVSDLPDTVIGEVGVGK